MRECRKNFLRLIPLHKTNQRMKGRSTFDMQNFVRIRQKVEEVGISGGDIFVLLSEKTAKQTRRRTTRNVRLS